MEGKVYGLNIHLLSFQLNPELVHNKDKIRVSITTFPEKQKQHFTINPKYIGDAHHFFTVNVTDKTEKILFVFKKKNIMKPDQIIASTVVKRDQLPKSPDDTNNTEVKNISILESIHEMKKENKGKEGIEKIVNANRKIMGEMKIQFELTNAFPDGDFNSREGGKKKGHSSSNKGYAKMENNENLQMNYI